MRELDQNFYCFSLQQWVFLYKSAENCHLFYQLSLSSRAQRSMDLLFCFGQPCITCVYFILFVFPSWYNGKFESYKPVFVRTIEKIIQKFENLDYDLWNYFFWEKVLFENKTKQNKQSPVYTIWSKITFNTTRSKVPHVSFTTAPQSQISLSFASWNLFLIMIGFCFPRIVQYWICNFR